VRWFACVGLDICSGLSLCLSFLSESINAIAFVCLWERQSVLRRSYRGDTTFAVCSDAHGIASPLVPSDGLDPLSMCRDVAAGLAHIHSRGFVHNDIAARNVLLSDDGVVSSVTRCCDSKTKSGEPRYLEHL
jgi:hypothetical protein